MPTCDRCKREYDNGTHFLHGCDPEDLEDLTKLTDPGEIELVNDPHVQRFGLMYEVLEGYRAERAKGETHDVAYFRACYEWDV